MRRLIKEVADVVRDLETLNLLEEKDVMSSLNFGRNTKKYTLSVTVTAAEEVVSLCLEMFQKIRSIGYTMSVVENNREDSLNSVLSVSFYE